MDDNGQHRKEVWTRTAVEENMMVEVGGRWDQLYDKEKVAQTLKRTKQNTRCYSDEYNRVIKEDNKNIKINNMVKV